MTGIDRSLIKVKVMLAGQVGKFASREVKEASFELYIGKAAPKRLYSIFPASVSIIDSKKKFPVTKVKEICIEKMVKRLRIGKMIGLQKWSC